MENVFAQLLFAIVIVGIYVLPAFIASVRRHRNFGAIMALDLLLGWTFVGWVAAFVWSLTANVDQDGKSTSADGS